MRFYFKPIHVWDHRQITGNFIIIVLENLASKRETLQSWKKLSTSNIGNAKHFDPNVK